MVRAIRCIGQVVLLFVAILAGYGVAAMDRVWGGTRTWAVSVVAIGTTALYSMILFIVILGAGLGYAWKKGVLEWK